VRASNSPRRQPVAAARTYKRIESGRARLLEKHPQNCSPPPASHFTLEPVEVLLFGGIVCGGLQGREKSNVSLKARRVAEQVS
jgi:hypothetical protein